MSIPAWFIVPLMGLSFSGLAALVAKTAVYCLFQRSLGMRKAIALGVLVHLLSLIAVLIGALLMTMWTSSTAAKVPTRSKSERRFHETPRDGPDAARDYEQPPLAFAVAYGMTTGAVFEFFCLFALRKRLTLKRIGTDVLAANAAYYVVLGIAYSLGEVLSRRDLL